jgi:hypothetical protein
VTLSPSLRAQSAGSGGGGSSAEVQQLPPH